MKDYVCEPLGNQHDRTQFDCGVSVLNEYLAKYAKQDVKRKASAVFVLLDRAEPKRVIGFYTLRRDICSPCRATRRGHEKTSAYPEIPAILVGRLARDVNYPGVGALLLSDAITRCVRVASEIAAKPYRCGFQR